MFSKPVGQAAKHIQGDKSDGIKALLLSPDEGAHSIYCSFWMFLSLLPAHPVRNTWLSCPCSNSVVATAHSAVPMSGIPTADCQEQQGRQRNSLETAERINTALQMKSHCSGFISAGCERLRSALGLLSPYTGGGLGSWGPTWHLDVALG